MLQSLNLMDYLLFNLGLLLHKKSDQTYRLVALHNYSIRNLSDFWGQFKYRYSALL